MSDTQKYGFYRYPRFSVNLLAEYLATNGADQRERVIRSAKFPKKPSVVAYSSAKRIICDFLGGNIGDLSYFDAPLRRFEARRRREPDGWMRDEMTRCVNAIASFKKTYARRRMGRYHFERSPSDLTLRREGVRINTRLDAFVHETDSEGVLYWGGCVLFIANTDVARRNVEARRNSVAAVINWSLEETNPNIEVLPRLCFSFDVFGEQVAKATASIDRLRNRVDSACREVSARWDGIAAPADYDGPDWQ